MAAWEPEATAAYPRAGMPHTLRNCHGRVASVEPREQPRHGAGKAYRWGPKDVSLRTSVPFPLVHVGAPQLVKEEATDILERELEDLQRVMSGRAGAEDVDLLLYDPIPGGSGLLGSLTGRWDGVLAAALPLEESCPSACATACVNGRHTFRNAFYPPPLDRDTAADRLRTWGPAPSPWLRSGDTGHPPVEAGKTLRALLLRPEFLPPLGHVGQRSVDPARPPGLTISTSSTKTPDKRTERGLHRDPDGMRSHVRAATTTDRVVLAGLKLRCSGSGSLGCGGEAAG